MNSAYDVLQLRCRLLPPPVCLPTARNESEFPESGIFTSHAIGLFQRLQKLSQNRTTVVSRSVSLYLATSSLILARLSGAIKFLPVAHRVLVVAAPPRARGNVIALSLSFSHGGSHFSLSTLLSLRHPTCPPPRCGSVCKMQDTRDAVVYLYSGLPARDIFDFSTGVLAGVSVSHRDDPG